MSPPPPDGWDDDYEDEGPLTHLSDDDYDAFLASEFDGKGRRRRGPPIERIVAVVVVLLLVLFWVLSR